ncbi:MAG: type II toxin-antitoxin system Phd/YefM family antitoxin [Verrucomicrobia bacterium]|jgi:prevent-host-death family protein|nr:type II toxin-antitoxin system Phd/YefM family antitoxin [Verrucomicrobiota bacterium]
MKFVPSYEAKSKFSEILREASEGEVFVITRNGRRMAELRPCEGPEIRRKRGMMREKFGPVGEEFHESLEEFSSRS